jgi:glycosyltransferase involved in cell wall biosynthesis
VIAGNELLAEHLKQYTDRITVVPSLVETADIPMKRHADRKRLVVGWIGSRTTAVYVEAVAQILTQVSRLISGHTIKLLMIGGEIRPPERVEYEAVPWSPERERAALKEMDVGIMPLPNTPWTRGKCAYKALQYMAAGVPVVADDVGVTAEVIGEGSGGWVVRDQTEWVDALLTVLSNPTLRGHLGTCGRARVEAKYSVDAWAPTIATILRGER